MDEDKLQELYLKAKREIVSVYTKIEKGEIPILNLNILKEFILEYDKDETILPDVNIDYIVLSSENVEKPLLLSTKKKVILTRRNFDLSLFTREELVEILHFLDIMITDNSYDNLREEIVKHITAISSFSTIDKL